MPKDKISMDDLTSGKSFDHWATANQLESLIGLSIGQPRYHKFMENFAKGMSSGKIGIEKAFRDAGRGLERFAPSSKIATEGLEETGTTGKKTSKKLSILGSMTASAATRLEQFQRSAARVDGTLKSTMNEFTSLLKTTASLAGTLGAGVGAMTGLTGKLGKLTGKMGIFGTALKGAGAQIPAIVGVMSAAVGVVMGVVDDFGQSLRKTADFGISFGRSFMDLRVELGKAGLGLDMLEKQLAQNSEAFALMGPNVHKGVINFARWRDEQNKLTHASQATLGYFENLGFAAEDMTDLFLKDFRNRRLAGVSEQQAMDLTTKRLKELAQEAKAASEATGESRKLLVQQNIEMRSDPQWLAHIANMGDKGEALNRSLEIMATTMGFEGKQKKAMQDSIRLGGDISLLNESVLGNAFQYLRLMPKQRDLLERMLKNVAEGNLSPDELKNDIKEFIIEAGDFAKTAEGKYLAKVGNNIIQEMGVYFENLQAHNRLLRKPGGVDALFNKLHMGLDRSNVVIARQQQASLILSNIFASGKTSQLMKAMTGTELEAALRGEEGAFDKLASIFEKAGKAGGWLTQAIASMTIKAASVVIEYSGQALDFFGLGTPSAGNRVTKDGDIVRANETVASLGEGRMFTTFARNELGGATGYAGTGRGRASAIDFRTGMPGGDRAIALQEFLTRKLGDEGARAKMKEMQETYGSRYRNILADTAENPEERERQIGNMMRDFRSALMEFGDITGESKTGASFRNRIFRHGQVAELSGTKTLIASTEKANRELEVDIDALIDEIRNKDLNEQAKNTREQKIAQTRRVILGNEESIAEMKREVIRLNELLATEIFPTTPQNKNNATSPGEVNDTSNTGVDRSVNQLLASIDQHTEATWLAITGEAKKNRLAMSENSKVNANINT